VNRTVTKAAGFISILGHPLLILSVTTVLVSFHFNDRANASLISAVIIGLVIIPVTVHNISKARNKVYTNFDVSDRKQRQSFYRFGLIVLTIGTIALYFIPGAESFFIGTLFALFMMGTSAVVNIKLKASLHTSVITYVSISCYNIDMWITIGLLLFGVLVACSRVILQRHTKQEVITGALLGITFGLLHQLYNLFLRSAI
jgi:membrane-associated phospholipid phosphatase